MKYILGKVGIFTSLLLLFLTPYPALSMTPVSDDVLEGVTAGEGVSIIFSNIQANVEFNPLAVRDTNGSSANSNAAYFYIPAFSGDFKINRLVALQPTTVTNTTTIDQTFRIGEYGDSATTSSPNDYAYHDYNLIDTVYDFDNPPGSPAVSTHDFANSALSIDIYNDSSGDHSWLPSGGGFVIGLPTVQLSITDWQTFQLRVGHATTDASSSLFASIGMTNNFLEILGGDIGITARTGEGLDIYFNGVEAYWNTSTFDIIANQGSINGSQSGLTENHTLQLNNLLLHGDVEEDSTGHPDEWGPYQITGHLSLNMETDTSTDISYFQAAFPVWDDNMNLTLGQMKYQGVDFGFWSIRDIQLYPDSYLRIAGRDGTSTGGIDLEILSRWRFGQLRYEYGSGNNYSEFRGISLTGTINSITADPSTWFPGSYDPGFFKIGDLANGSSTTAYPLSIDVGGSSSSSHNIVISAIGNNSNPPIQGTIAVESFNIGGAEFGQMIMENIQVHELKITLKNDW